MKLTVKEFINNVLINEIKSIQKKYGYHYLSFSLISQGIEFLGACIDNYDFDKSGKSANRFRLAIKDLFPLKYDIYNKSSSVYDLYKNLRCGLLHKMLPKSDIELIQRIEIPDFGNHLEIKRIRNKNRLILVSQDLFDDFEKAANEVIKRIDNKIIVHKKVYGRFFSTEP